MLVPASFSTTHAIDRSIILGGQAVAEALASSDKSGIPFFWSEKELDHGDKAELLICAIRGVSKVRFEVDTGEVRIMGSKSRLLQTLVAGGGVNAVPTQGLKWRTGWDSNPR